MTILVTGGLGTIGTALVRELRARGKSVHVCDLWHDEQETGFSVRTDCPRPQYTRCDVGEFRQVEQLFRNSDPFDLVYHCAAEFGRWNGEDFTEQLWKTNVIGTKNMLRMQQQFNFRLVHCSSSEVYGDWPGLMSESVPDAFPVSPLNDYAISKWANEQQIKNAIMAFGAKTVIVRLFNTYGPGEFYSPYRSVNCRFLYCALREWPWIVYRDHRRSSTYIDDTVRTMAEIADHFHEGSVYNIGGGVSHSIEELCNIVLDITGASSQLVEYRDKEPLTTTQKQVDLTNAIRDLGHKNTVALLDGMERTAQWMRQTYHL